MVVLVELVYAEILLGGIHLTLLNIKQVPRCTEIWLSADNLGDAGAAELATKSKIGRKLSGSFSTT